MALADFIPAIWAARFTDALERARVYGASVNSRYQVDAQGNKIEIPTFSQDVTVGDYTGADISAAQSGDGETAELAIDQQKYFHIFVDDINAVQSRPDVMSEFLRRAVVKIAETQDAYLMARYAGAFADGRRNISANAAAATVETKLKAVIRLKQAMSDANIPVNNRWMAVNPGFIADLEEHFIANGATGVYAPATADRVVENGYAGNLLGFDLRVTTAIPSSGAAANKKLRFVASQGDGAVTMAESIREMEVYRPELRFGEAVKGLYVYGALAAEAERVFYLEVDDPKAS